jgi:ATP-binding cassette subfamily C exporter for protease/lipase
MTSQSIGPRRGESPQMNWIQNGIGAVLVKFRTEVVAIGIFSALINLLMLSPTLYMLQVFDRVMVSRSELTLLVLTLFVLLFYLVKFFCEWMRSKLMIGTGLRLDTLLGEYVFRAIFRDQLGNSGQPPAQIFLDMSRIRHWLTGASAFAFFDLPWSPIYLVVMFMLHPWLGWLTLIFMLVLAIFAWWATAATRNASQAAEDEERELNTFIYTKLRNADVVEAHGMVPNLLNRWWLHQAQALAGQVEAQSSEQRFTISSKELRTFMQSLSLAAGALLAIEGEITFGAMIAASLLMGRATAPIDQIVGGWRGFLSVRQSFQRLQSLLRQDERRDMGSLDLSGKLSIKLNGVSAMAGGRPTPILHNITTEFESGKINIVQGNSGAGKSTLGKVILGIWPDFRGDVLLNGCDIRSLDRKLIGPSLGYLPQNIELFAGTVAENIARMSVPDADMVVEAARITNTHDLILHLPKGYDTQIGEGGAALSGGQRQRIALARAFYGVPRLLVLDEPNANLDDAGEAALTKALEYAKERGSTIFLITHRPGITRIADRIVVMSHGQIDLYGEADAVRAILAERALSPAIAARGDEPSATALQPHGSPASA